MSLKICVPLLTFAIKLGSYQHNVDKTGNSNSQADQQICSKCAIESKFERNIGLAHLLCGHQLGHLGPLWLGAIHFSSVAASCKTEIKQEMKNRKVYMTTKTFKKHNALLPRV